MLTEFQLGIANKFSKFILEHDVEIILFSFLLLLALVWVEKKCKLLSFIKQHLSHCVFLQKSWKMTKFGWKIHSLVPLNSLSPPTTWKASNLCDKKNLKKHTDECEWMDSFSDKHSTILQYIHNTKQPQESVDVSFFYLNYYDSLSLACRFFLLFVVGNFQIFHETQRRSAHFFPGSLSLHDDIVIPLFFLHSTLSDCLAPMQQPIQFIGHCAASLVLCSSCDDDDLISPRNLSYRIRATVYPSQLYSGIVQMLLELNKT